MDKCDTVSALALLLLCAAGILYVSGNDAGAEILGWVSVVVALLGFLWAMFSDGGRHG